MKNNKPTSKKHYIEAKGAVQLRDVQQSDLDLFFTFQLDKEAYFMAAFTSKNPADHLAFEKHWTNILNDPDNITKTIVFKNAVVGHIAKFMSEGKPEITYWLDKKVWGKGVATEALNLFLKIIDLRPLYARVAKDNAGSNRVLEKCGFKIIGEDKGFAEGRGQETEEYLRILQ